MKNKLRYAIMFVGALICGVAVGNFMTAPTIPDNTKSMTFVYEVQEDGSLQLIEEQQHVPMTLTQKCDILMGAVGGLAMIIYSVFLYPKKRGETINGTN